MMFKQIFFYIFIVILLKVIEMIEKSNKIEEKLESFWKKIEKFQVALNFHWKINKRRLSNKNVALGKKLKK